VLKKDIQMGARDIRKVELRLKLFQTSSKGDEEAGIRREETKTTKRKMSV
jgi:hypothetical protein